jgi:hypothetical protein
VVIHTSGPDVQHAPERPLIVAHRAGNDLALLRRAEAMRVDLVEADVHLHRGRLEARHLKTAGPLPLLWDRWRLAPAWTPRLELAALLDAVDPATELMLDLKGHDRRLLDHLVRGLADAGARERVTICSRDWRLLAELDGLPGARIVHSVGSAHQLRSLWHLAARGTLTGVSIHRRLLDRATVERLRAHLDLLLSWPVEDAATARTLAGCGVHGLISQRFDALATLFRSTAPAV